MTYRRVIPRDLFNEAKLLKCLGALYIASEYRNDLRVVFEHEGTGEHFDIRQNPDDGSIYVGNVAVTFRGHNLRCYTPLNSKLPYPLVAEHNDETAYVFTDDGKLSEEFLALVPLVTPDF